MACNGYRSVLVEGVKSTFENQLSLFSGPKEPSMADCYEVDSSSSAWTSTTSRTGSTASDRSSTF